MPCRVIRPAVALIARPTRTTALRWRKRSCKGLRRLPCLVVMTILGCSPGSGEGLDEQGRPLAVNPPTALDRVSAIMPTFEAIQATVFNVHCIECHAGPAAPVGMRLSADVAFAMLVGVPSVEVPTLARVAPNAPDRSYLLRKLEGRDIVGGRMPLGQPPLASAQIDAIRGWIALGAPSPAATPTDPPSAPPPGATPMPSPNPAPLVRVSASVPGANERLRTPPAELMLVFSADIDPSTVRPDTVTLTAAGGDGGFSAGGAAQIALSNLHYDAATRSVRAGFIAALPTDRYRIRVVGNGPAPLQDLASRALDGDADGAAGGDFTADFSLDTLAFAPTLAAIQSNVFDTICIECHAGDNATLGMRLEDGLSHGMLIGVASLEVPNLNRIQPGDADNSYLVQKIEGRAAVGARMPLGGPPLALEDIAAIRAWIEDGALP